MMWNKKSNKKKLLQVDHMLEIFKEGLWKDRYYHRQDIDCMTTQEGKVKAVELIEVYDYVIAKLEELRSVINDDVQN